MHYLATLHTNSGKHICAFPTMKAAANWASAVCTVNKDIITVVITIVPEETNHEHD